MSCKRLMEAILALMKLIFYNHSTTHHTCAEVTVVAVVTVLAARGNGDGKEILKAPIFHLLLCTRPR